MIKKPATTKRKYDSRRRKAQARETRRQIISSARILFIQKGYDGTTIDAIAELASVSSETIYAVFGNKRKILWRLLDISIGGDDESISLMERPNPQAVLANSNPLQQVQLFSKDITEILARVAPIFEILRTAAKVDEELDQLLQTMLAQRLENMTMLVKQIAKNGGLRKELDIESAARTVWAITSPEIFLLMTRDQLFSNEMFQQWLYANLSRLLLA